MKKKIILALTACLFAAGTIINMHLAQNNQNTDISLADIAVMAQADGEYPPEHNAGGCVGCVNVNGQTQVLITCWYCQGCNVTCVETPCTYGSCV